MRNIWVISDQAFQFPIPVSFTGYDSFTNKVYALSPEGNLYSYNIVTEEFKDEALLDITPEDEILSLEMV